jgi:hypothetical protein
MHPSVDRSPGQHSASAMQVVPHARAPALQVHVPPGKRHVPAPQSALSQQVPGKMQPVPQTR